MGRIVFRYWGWLALAAVIYGWSTRKLAWGAILGVSLAAVAYFLFQAPVWCRAIGRNGTFCRNNAHGLIGGCHLRQHKKQMLTMAFVPKWWREFNEGLWSTPSQRTAAVASLAGVVSALAAVVPLVAH